MSHEDRRINKQGELTNEMKKCEKKIRFISINYSKSWRIDTSMRCYQKAKGLFPTKQYLETAHLIANSHG